MDAFFSACYPSLLLTTRPACGHGLSHRSTFPVSLEHALPLLHCAATLVSLGSPQPAYFYAVHLTATVVLTGSNVMSIEAWDWDKGRRNIQSQRRL